jgi:hypothetical protein
LMAAHFGHDGRPAAVERICDHPAYAALGRWLSSCLRRSPVQRPSAEALRERLAALTPQLKSMPWPIG